jgi:hypothetical protein
VAVGQEVAPFLLKCRYAFVDGFHARLLVGREQCSGTHEILVGLFQELLVFALEGFVFVVVNILDALEQLGLNDISCQGR